MDYCYVHGAHRMAPLDTESGQLSAITTMTLMQMIADTYESARVDWEKNADREIIEGVDDPELFGPINEAQRRVEGWLVHAQFLPPRKRYKSESKNKDEPVNLQPLAIAKLQIQKETSKTLKIQRLKFPERTLNLIKINNLLWLVPTYIWKKAKTKILPRTASSSSSILTQETRLGPTPETPRAFDTQSNTNSCSPRISYIQRPRFATPTRSRTLELEIERPVAVEDIRPALPRRSGTLPFLQQMAGSHPDVQLNPVPANRHHMYRIAKAPCETEQRQLREIITSKQGILVSNPQHEITVWTLLAITMLGYFCFFLIFLACIIMGLKRLIHRSVSLLTFMSDDSSISDI